METEVKVIDNLKKKVISKQTISEKVKQKGEVECPRCGLFIVMVYRVRNRKLNQVFGLCRECAEFQRLENRSFIDENK